MVFGYSDARVKNWVNLRKFMEGKQLHIVNTARFIAQGLCFDLYFLFDLDLGWIKEWKCLELKLKI